MVLRIIDRLDGQLQNNGMKYEVTIGLVHVHLPKGCTFWGEEAQDKCFLVTSGTVAMHRSHEPVVLFMRHVPDITREHYYRMPVIINDKEDCTRKHDFGHTGFVCCVTEGPQRTGRSPPRAKRRRR